MDARVVNALLKSVVETFKKAAGLEVSVGKPAIVNDLDREHSVYTVIGFTGDIKGNLVYSIDDDAGLLIVSKMMGMPYNQLDALALSAVGELGNMVGGSLAMSLEKIGKKITIAPPSVITGNNINVHCEGVILCLPSKVAGKDLKIYLVIHSD